MNKTSTAAFNSIADIAAKDFAEAMLTDEKFTETMQELTFTFIQEKLTFVDEEAQFELALMLFDRLKLTAC